MYFRKNILFVLLMMAGSVANGQSDIILTQQWFSRINMNPAATGNSDNVDVFLLNRQQWVGFDNAPKTTIMNAHTYFNSIQSGLGMSLLYDKLGVSHQTVNAMLAYAYHIDLTNEILLSTGLSGGLYNSNWDPGRNEFPDKGNITNELDMNKSSRSVADFNAGLELNGYGITLGASMTHLLNARSTDDHKPWRGLYAYLRYSTTIDWDYDIVPGVIYRYANFGHFLDFNLLCYYKKKYWAGVSFRPDNSFAALLGIEFGMFRVGYSYDRSIGGFSSLAANTHEVMLSVRIQKPQQGRQTTRFLD